MEQPIRIKVGDRDEARAYKRSALILGSVFALTPFAAYLDGKGTVGGLICLSTVVVVFLWGFLRGYMSISRLHRDHVEVEIVATESELSVLDCGVVRWSLPWSDFGGYRRIQPKTWKLIPDYDTGGIEVLDSKGDVAGILPGRLPTNSGRRHEGELWSCLLRRMNSLASVNWKPTPPPDFASIPTRQAISRGIPLLLMSAAGFWVLDQVLSYWRGNERSPDWVVWLADGPKIAILLVPLALAILMGGIYLCAPFMCKAILAEEKQREAARPIDEHRLRFLLSEGKVELDEGQSYRYIMPELLRDRLNQSIILPAWLMVVLPSLLWVALTISYWKDPTLTLTAFSTCTVLVGGMAALSLTTALKHSRFRSNLGDRLSVSKDAILVQAASGEEFEIAHPSGKALRLPPRGGFNIQSVRTREGKRYLVDFSYLQKQVN